MKIKTQFRGSIIFLLNKLYDSKEIRFQHINLNKDIINLSIFNFSEPVIDSLIKIPIVQPIVKIIILRIARDLFNLHISIYIYTMFNSFGLSLRIYFHPSICCIYSCCYVAVIFCVVAFVTK